jgi:hypothetical protein
MAAEVVRSRLGRGMAALLGEVEEEVGVERRGSRTVPVEFLRSNPRNPRRQFAEADLADPLHGRGRLVEAPSAASPRRLFLSRGRVLSVEDAEEPQDENDR